MVEPSKRVVREVDGFRLIRQLGQGGMGTVYLARQQTLQRDVALKILPPHMANDAEFAARFHREAQSAALFAHPNVVGVHLAGRDERYGVHYIAFEYVSGGSLEQMLGQAGRLDEARAVTITRGIAQALCFAESKEMVHRDVKPDNILLTPEGIPKLADLGLAKQPQREASSVTQTGMVLGTPLFMAPEQALGVSDLDIRTDIYALGLCLWRMLTGLMPFDEDRTNSSLQILTKHINEDLVDVRERRPEISAHTAQLVLWMTARDRADRYPTARALARDIDRVLYGEAPLGPSAAETLSDVAATVIESGPMRRSSGRHTIRKPSGRQPIATPRRLTVPIAAGILISALGIGIGAAVAMSGGEPPSPPERRVAVAPPTPPANEPATPLPQPTADPMVAADDDDEDEEPIPQLGNPAPVPPSQPLEPLVDQPTPKPTAAPKPEAQPKQPGFDPKVSEELAPRVGELMQRYFADPETAEPYVRKLKRELRPKVKSYPPLDKLALKRLMQTTRAGMRMVEAPIAQRTEITRIIEDLIKTSEREPIRSGLGMVVAVFTRELHAMWRCVEATRAYIRESSPRREIVLSRELRRIAPKHHPEIQQLFAFPAPRRFRDLSQQFRAKLQGQDGPTRLRALHALFARYVAHTAKMVDRWPLIPDMLQPATRRWFDRDTIVGGNSARRAIARCLRAELRDVQGSGESLQSSGAETLVSALYAARRTAKEPRSTFLSARLVPVSDDPVDLSNHHGVVVEVKGMRKKASSITFDLGSKQVVVRRRHITAGDTKRTLNVTWGPQSSIALIPAPGGVVVRVIGRGSAQVSLPLGDVDGSCSVQAKRAKILTILRVPAFHGSAAARIERPRPGPFREGRRRGDRRRGDRRRGDRRRMRRR